MGSQQSLFLVEQIWLSISLEDRIQLRTKVHISSFAPGGRRFISSFPEISININ